MNAQQIVYNALKKQNNTISDKKEFKLYISNDVYLQIRMIAYDIDVSVNNLIEVACDSLLYDYNYRKRKIS